MMTEQEELARLKVENEQLRTLLEEASDLLSDAVELAMYGCDASGHFSVDKAEDWERRYRRVMSSKDPSSDSWWTKASHAWPTRRGVSSKDEGSHD